MINKEEIKQQAKEQLKENLLPLIGAFFVTSIIAWLTRSFTFVIPIIGAVIPLAVNGAMELGMSKIYLNIADGGTAEFDNLFSGFDNFLPAALLQLLLRLFVALWSMLFVIPGYIMGIAYSMSRFIMCDNPDMPASECIKESKNMMDGHKMEYFKLTLSFIPWFLLGVVTCGIGLFYAIPYMELATAIYYRQLKGESSGYRTTKKVEKKPAKKTSKAIDKTVTDESVEDEPVETKKTITREAEKKETVSYVSESESRSTRTYVAEERETSMEPPKVKGPRVAAKQDDSEMKNWFKNPGDL